MKERTKHIGLKRGETHEDISVNEIIMKKVLLQTVTYAEETVPPKR